MERVVQRNKKRIYGIDILKMISMFMVVTIHVLGNGGILGATKKHSLNYKVAYFIKIAVFCAVNVFGLISGYLIINTRCSRLKIIPLWLTAFFYSIIITTCFKYVPSIKKNISTKEYIKYSFFPAANRNFWYFTSYFGLYFFIPYLNKILHSISKEDYKKLIITIILLYSFVPLLNVYKVDLFVLNKGHSPWWLGALYIMGAYFKLYPVKISKIVCFFVYLISVIIAWLSYLYTSNINVINYDSFFILTSSISLLLLFTQVNVSNKILQKLITIGGSVTFSVYLMHDHPYCHSYLNKKFSKYGNEKPYMLILKVLATAAVIYVSCSIIDLFRYYLFKVLRINSIPRVLSEKFPKPIILKRPDKYKNLSEDDTLLVVEKIELNDNVGSNDERNKLNDNFKNKIEP